MSSLTSTTDLTPTHQPTVRPVSKPIGRPLVLVAISVLSGVFFFYGLWVGEFYRTESLRAIIGAEFLRSGNWVVPRLYSEPLFTKPPGMYAAIAAASWPLGHVTEWTARLPSAIAATALVVIMYSLFACYLTRTAGLLAAALTPLSMMVLDKGTSAEIDMLQVAWVAGAIGSAVIAIDRHDANQLRRACGWWIAAYLCVAGGFLTKWTAPAFFGLTITTLLWWRLKLRFLVSWPHLVGLTVAMALCGGWVALAVFYEGWSVFAETVKRQAFSHLLPTHHHRPYPWLESLSHPLRIWLAALPVSLFALPALSRRFLLIWDERERRLLQLFHCWLWPNLVFWSLVPAHNIRHSFPLYPPIAGLAAMVCWAWVTGKLQTRFVRIRPLKAIVALLASWVIVKLVFVHYVTPQRLLGREPRAKGELLASLVPNNTLLYVFRLKDEGILFYFGREIRRLPSLQHLPSDSEPMYCILCHEEWQNANSPMRVMRRLTDEQGEPIVLVEIMSAKALATELSHADTRN